MKKKLLFSLTALLAVAGLAFAVIPSGWTAEEFWNEYGTALTTDYKSLTAETINADQYATLRNACAAWNALDDEQRDAVLDLKDQVVPPVPNLDRNVGRLQAANLDAARGALDAIVAKFDSSYDATTYTKDDLEKVAGEETLLKSWDAVKDDTDLASFFSGQAALLAKVASAKNYATTDKWVSDANAIDDPNTTKDVSLEDVEALLTEYDALVEQTTDAQTAKATLDGYKTVIEGQISDANDFVAKVNDINAGIYTPTVDVTSSTDVATLETEYDDLMQPAKAAEAKTLIDGWRSAITLAGKNAEITGYVNGFNEALGVVAEKNGVFNLTDNDVNNDYTGLTENTDYQWLSQLVENYQKIYEPEDEAYWEGTNFEVLTKSIINANKVYAQEMKPYYESMKAAVEFLADVNNLYGADATTSDLVKYEGENDGLKNVIDVQNALANDETVGIEYILQLYTGAKKANLDEALYNEAMKNYQTKFRKDAADTAVAAYKAKYTAKGAALHADYEEAKEDYDPTTVKALGSRDAFNALTTIASDVIEYTFDAEKYGTIAAIALTDADTTDVRTQARGQLTAELATLNAQLRSAAQLKLEADFYDTFKTKYVDVITYTDPTAEDYTPSLLYTHLEYSHTHPTSGVKYYKGLLVEAQRTTWDMDKVEGNWIWDATTNLILENTTAPATDDDQIGKSAFNNFKTTEYFKTNRTCFDNMYKAGVFMIEYKDFIEKEVADITSADKDDAIAAKDAYDALSDGAKPYVLAIKEGLYALYSAAVNDDVTSGSITLYTGVVKSGTAVTEDYSSLTSIIDIAAKLKDAEGNLRPNALVYIDATLDVALPTNVIAKNADGDWYATAIELQDFENFYVPEDVNAEKITIHKTIYAEGEGKVNPMYLPIDVTLEDLQKAFGNNVIARYLNAVYEKQDETDPTLVELYLNFHRKAAGETCNAYMPYTLECAAGDYDIEVENTTLKATVASQAVTCTTAGSGIKASLYGLNQQLSIKSEAKKENYVISKTTGTFGIYGVETENGEVKRDANGDVVGKSQKLPAGRLRLVLTKGAGIQYVIRTDFNEEVTGIENVTNESKVEGIYTINGVKVNDMSKPGLYIVNGKKVLKK